MENQRVVMCMKWGPAYPAAYVNVLYSAVRKHLDKPFRFVCLTNEPEGLDEGIETFPIPDLGLPQERYNHGAWPKLAVFKPDLYGLKGTCLFIDLDTVIWNNLEPFFEAKGDFLAIGLTSTWICKPKPWIVDKWKEIRTSYKHAKSGQPVPTARSTMGTGIFRFELGRHGNIYDNFLRDKKGAFAVYGNEQEFAEHQLESWNPWEPGTILSFKMHLRRPILVDLLLPPKTPPVDVPVIAFHGNPRPIDLVHKGHSSMREAPHYWRAPVKWVRDYWLENGYPANAPKP